MARPDGTAESGEIVFHFVQQALLVRLVLFGKRLAKLFEQFALLPRQLAGNFYIHLHEQIATAAALQARHAEVLQTDTRSGLDALRNFHLLQPIESQQIELCSQHRLRHINGHHAQQIVALALKNGMFLHLDDDIQVARRAAIEARLSLVRQLEMSARIHARWDGHLELTLGAHLTLPTALGAGPPHNLAAPSTLSTSAADLQEALLVNHFAAPVTHGAG